MFDLITGNATHTPHTPGLPILVSTVGHSVAVGLLIVLPWLYVTDQLPEPSTMMAFVTAPPPPPVPPPPPAPVQARARPPEAVPVPTSGAAAPVEAPPQIAPEQPAMDPGVEGLAGVEGGVPDGIMGGIVGGVDILPPPPPPPPRGPMRIGGQIQQPTLVHRVDPVYPSVAVAAAIEGTVILEATVDEEGRVVDLKVLRSQGVLDRAALAAVRQWRYSPVLLNGRPEKFILTVVVSFRLEDVKR